MTRHIKNFLTNTFSKKNSWQWNLLANWTTVIGELADKVTLEKIQGDTLILGITNSAWLQELYLLTPLLRSRINATLDAPHIKRVRFKAVGKKNRETYQPHTAQKKISELRLVLTPKEQRALQSLDDHELRNALKAYKMRCLKERI